MIVKYILVLCVFLSLLLLSLSSIAQNNLAKATFAGGCFWCMESPFEKMEGVISVVSGYTDGHKEDPIYEEVSAGVTGHMEAVQILYDPSKTTFLELLNVFWKQIDPTDPGGQFVDRGGQYGTAVFYHNEEQRILAEKIKEDEIRKHKAGLNIKRLEALNTNQKESIKQFHTSGRGKYRGVSELQQINVTTAPRFEVILEILKKQDARIRELENIINSQ